MKFLKNNKYHILSALFLIAFLCSIIISFANIQEICGLESGCDLVQSSKYAYFFGIKNSYFGILIFFFLIILTTLQIFSPTKKKRKMINRATIIGSIISLYFIFLQIFIIKSYCIYCLITDISLLIALLIILFTWKK